MPEKPCALGVRTPTAGKLRLIWLVAVFLACSAAPAFAQTYGIFTGSSSTQIQIDSTRSVSWYITVYSGTVSLAGATLEMRRGGAATGNVTLTLYAGGPGGTFLTSVTLPASTFGTSFSDEVFLFSSAQSLPPGNYYASVTSTAPSFPPSRVFVIRGVQDATISANGSTPISSSIATITAAATGPNITLSKTATPTVTSGGTIQYTINLGNDGGTASGTSATVRDQLPAGVVATAVAPGGARVSSVNCGLLPSAPGALLTCTASIPSGIPAASANGTGSFTITATVLSSPGTITNFASVDPSGGAFPAAPGASCTTRSCGSASTIVTAPAVSDLTISKTHSGNFRQGQTDAEYVITATNAGTAATSGAVTITDVVPAKLTPTAATGPGWSCGISAQTVTCTRSTALPAGSSYPAVTLTVSVAADAPASVTNTASVSGGGETNTSNNTASDPTTIGSGADLTLTKTHTGTFTQGQTGAVYTINVANNGTGPSSGAVSVADTVPSGLTPTAGAGSGWSCSIAGQDVTCTRSDALAAGQAYPAITLTVNVAPTASNVTNTATVSGGGDINSGNNSASDPTIIGSGADLTISKTHSGNFTQGQTGAAYTITVQNAGTGPSSGAVSVTDTVPSGLTPTSAAGGGWSCSISGQDVTCTRSDALAAGASYPAITLTVNVAPTAPNVTNTATVSGGGDNNGGNNTASDPTTIGSGADLTISKTHSGNFTQGQTGAAYTVTASNSGTGPSSGMVTVTDTLPSGITPTGAAGTGWTCSLSGQDVNCTRGDAVAAGASYPAITLTVNVAPTASNVTNTATVAGGGDINAGNNSASDPTTIGSGADLTIAKSHSGSFTQGQTGATYSITVSNSGSGPTSGVVTVSDSVPSDLTPTAAAGSGWSCSISGQDVTCTRSDALAASQSYPAITLTVNVAPTASNVTNVAAVSGGGEMNGGNNTASDPTTIGSGADLTIAKTHSGNFTQGQTGAAYSITVTNAGSGPTSGVVTVADSVPSGLTPTAAAGSGWSCSISGQDVTCTRSDALAASQNYPAITLTVNVAPTAPNVTNTATVSGGGEINAGNNSASDPTSIGSGADLTISKTHSGSFTQGQTGATYTVTVSNGGTGPSSGAVTVADTVPAGLTATGAAGTGWTCSVSGQDVSCTRSDALAAGASYPAITLTVDVAPTASNVTNTATVSGGSDINAGNNTASDPTTIGSGADLTIAKSHSGNFTQGQTGATYTVTVSNSGSGPTAGTVTVADTLPSGLTPTGGAGTGWSCSVSGQTVTCTRSDALPAGQAYPAITLTVDVAPTASNVTNTATLSGGNDINGGNNSASDVTTIGSGADLTTNKAHSGSFTQGQTGATYTITVSNAGGGPTAGAVTVADTLPAGLTPTAAAGSGWSCSIAGQDVTCTRSDALAASQTYPAITLTVDVAPSASNVTNTATVSGGGDINGGNNSASDPTTIGNGPDLTLTKSHTGSFMQGQAGATYTVTVSNAGATASSGLVTVSDTVPAGLTPTAASGAGWTCSIAGQDVSCTRADALAAAGSYPAITLTVDVAPNATNVTNVATLSGGGDVNGGNNSASDPTAIGGGADLTIAKTHAGSFAQGQGGATFTITVTNSGTGVTSGAVTVADMVPAGLTPAAATGPGWSCTVSGQTVSCARDDALAAGQSHSPITLAVSVTSGASSFTNTATVSGGADVNAGNNSASDTVTVTAGADLTLALARGGTFVQGKSATYIITASNVGGAPSVGAVTVTDSIPAGLVPVAATGPGWICSITGQDVTCTRSDALAAGASHPALTIAVNVAARVGVTNTAFITGGGDVNSANNSATDATTVLGGPDLTLTVTHAGNFMQGQTGAAYTVVATNVGASTTSGLVTIATSLPAGLAPTAAAGSGWACTLSGQDATCTRGDALAAGASYPAITLTVTVALDATDTTTTVSVSGGADVKSTNNSAADPTTITVLAGDLIIEKQHVRDFVRGQRNASYTIRVRNLGPRASRGTVSVIDDLPQGLQLVSAAGEGWSCAGATCQRSDVLAADDAYPTLAITVSVDADAPASLTNTAMVSGGADINASNNTASDPTVVSDFKPSDFQLGKVADKSLLRPGDRVNVRIEARNISVAPIDDVRLIDTLPRGFTYIPGTARLEIAGGAGAGGGGQTSAAAGTQKIIEPAISGSEVSFSIGTETPGTLTVIRYTALVGVDSPPGLHQTILRGSAVSPLGERILATPVELAVIVMPSTFATGQLAVGRVFHDVDNDGTHDPAEPGLPNVRVIVPSGSSAITDRDGMYNLPALPSGALVIAVDPATLPPGYRVRRAGRADGFSQLQRTPLASGALLTQNFAIVADQSAAPLPVAAAPAAWPAPVQPAVAPTVAPSLAPMLNRDAPRVRVLSVAPASSAIAADGRARTIVTVKAFGENAAPVSALVQLQTSAGQLLSAVSTNAGGDPCATSESGTEVPRAFRSAAVDVINGQGRVCLVSDVHPGVARLTAAADDDAGAVKVTASVTFQPVERAPLLVGIGELSIGNEARADQTIHRNAVQAQGQLFFQDTFAGGSQITVALNSERPINGTAADRLFQLDPLERAYPVFGDTSTRQELAQSNARVYARLDRGRSHVMFGDLHGDVAVPGRSGLADVARHLTGFRLHVEPGDAHAFTAVVSRPDTAFRRDVISGMPFGAVRLSRAMVMPGSETVTIEVRDRRAPETVLRRELLVRSVDYLLDPMAGVLYLKRTVQMFDDMLNVTNLVATYDHQVTGLESAAYSARARTRVGGLQLGASGFAQEHGGSTFFVGSLEAEHALPRGGNVSIEVPVSRGIASLVDGALDGGLTRTAAAWRVQFEQSFARGQSVLRGQYQRVGEHFLNPFGSPAVAGGGIASATFETTPVKQGTLSVTVRHESNDTAQIDNDRFTLGTHWAQGFGERVKFTGGLDHRRYAEHRAGTSVESYLLTAQAEWRPIDRFTAFARREQNLADADQTYPNQSVFGGAYQLSPRTKLFATQRLSSAPIIPISGFQTAGLISPLSTRETAIGIATAVSSHTDVTSKFQLDRGVNGTDAFALIGVRTRVPVRGGVGIDWGFDHAEQVHGSRPDYTSGTIGLAYTSGDRFRSAVRYELQSREEIGHAFSAGMAGRLTDGVTVLFNYRVADVPLSSLIARDSQTIAAVAWRPAASDRHGLLFSWNHGNRDGALLAGEDLRIGRLSTDGYLAPGRGLELHSRVALIRSSDGALDSVTNVYLWQGRIQQRFLEYFDVAVEQRSTWQTGLDAARSAFAAEAGAWALPDLRLGLGYRTRPIDSHGVPVMDATDGGGLYFVMTSRLAGFFNLFGAPAPVNGADSKRD